jgi:hypothetical protein
MLKVLEESCLVLILAGVIGRLGMRCEDLTPLLVLN